jgi:hypothetical protein
MSEGLSRYAATGHHRVEGWLPDIAVAILLNLAGQQSSRGIRGPVCEIGVHHGRLFILLHLLTRGQELAAGWDLFEHQDENVDRSGRGDKSRLLENLHEHGCDLARVRIETANSLTLTRELILRTCGGQPRLFSVDGGHTADITFSDLRLAAESIQAGGLIVLDDFFNESWPGVAEGTCRYMAEPPLPLYPVVIGGNKFVFCGDAEAAREYQRHLTFEKTLRQRATTVFGHPVVAITPTPARARDRKAPKSILTRAVSKIRKRVGAGKA